MEDGSEITRFLDGGGALRLEKDNVVVERVVASCGWEIVVNWGQEGGKRWRLLSVDARGGVGVSCQLRI